MREKLTKGNTEFLGRLMDAYYAHMLHDYDEAKKNSIFSEVKRFISSRSCLARLDSLGQILSTPPASKLESDKTTYVHAVDGWKTLVLEDAARSFGKYGEDAVSGLSELLLYTNALSRAFGNGCLFYRGEHRYGYKLCSRAERHMETGSGAEAGITERELQELRRFQSSFKADPPSDFLDNRELPADDSPKWLPIMQHYDDSFGTRLLDITSSPFAGLYFACVAWDGTIDESCDGLIYAFFPAGQMPIRGNYYDEMPGEYDPEMDELPSNTIEELFVNWTYPELWRLYESTASSPREMAQDGSFLVKGALTDEYGFGQGFKFRVPGVAKTRVARELWLAGYTPKRIVRGPIGIEAHRRLGIGLGIHKFNTP